MRCLFAIHSLCDALLCIASALKFFGSDCVAIEHIAWLMHLVEKILVLSSLVGVYEKVYKKIVDKQFLFLYITPLSVPSGDKRSNDLRRDLVTTSLTFLK